MKRALIILECEQKSIKKTAATKGSSQRKARPQHISSKYSESDFEVPVPIDTDDGGAECIFCGVFSEERTGSIESKSAKGGVAVDVLAAQKI